MEHIGLIFRDGLDEPILCLRFINISFDKYLSLIPHPRERPNTNLLLRESAYIFKPPLRAGALGAGR